MKPLFLIAAAALMISTTPATTQALRTFECSKLAMEQVSPDKFDLTTQHYTVTAADQNDALVQCAIKVEEEKKRANRRVMRT